MSLVSVESMRKSILNQIMNEIGDGLVVALEPHVKAKMKQMICLNMKNEVYGKLLIEEETIGDVTIPVVKEVFIPYQTVSVANFESSEEQVSKWLIELNKDKYGRLRDQEEVSYITKRLLGHFHSHQSVGANMLSPSATDTEDVLEHGKDAPYWIEIIGTLKGFSGRLYICRPFSILTGIKVIEKWWGNFEDTIKEAEGKIWIKESRTTITYGGRSYLNDIYEYVVKQNGNKKENKTVDKEDQSSYDDDWFIYYTDEDDEDDVEIQTEINFIMSVLRDCDNEFEREDYLQSAIDDINSDELFSEDDKEKIINTVLEKYKEEFGQ